MAIAYVATAISYVSLITINPPDLVGVHKFQKKTKHVIIQSLFMFAINFDIIIVSKPH